MSTVVSRRPSPRALGRAASLPAVPMPLRLCEVGSTPSPGRTQPDQPGQPGQSLRALWLPDRGVTPGGVGCAQTAGAGIDPVGPHHRELGGREQRRVQHRRPGQGPGGGQGPAALAASVSTHASMLAWTVDRALAGFPCTCGVGSLRR